MKAKRVKRSGCEIVVFPHDRLVGVARRMIDLSETRGDAAMSAIWETEMDRLEAQMIRSGIRLEERALQLNTVYCITQAEKNRRICQGRQLGSDEAM